MDFVHQILLLHILYRELFVCKNFFYTAHYIYIYTYNYDQALFTGNYFPCASHCIGNVYQREDCNNNELAIYNVNLLLKQQNSTLLHKGIKALLHKRVR